MAKAEPVRMDVVNPTWTCQLVRDTNGNWFACCQTREGANSGRSYCTATYTTPVEAVQEALSRMHG